MKRLVFVDDDRDELESMERLVGGAYAYVGLHWPREVPNRLTIGQPTPAIFVSDLYVPSLNGRDELIDFPPEVLARQMELAKKTAEAFMELYPGLQNAKRRMRQTMGALVQGRELLDEQWQGLAQSPEHGLGILALVRDEYPGVPFVFYSRKMTPDDVIRTLRAGAADAIQKRDWRDPNELLQRLRAAGG